GCETFLTAGHCLNGSTAGTVDTNAAHYMVFLQHGGFFGVASVAADPSFNFPTADVAVVKLTKQVCINGSNDGTACVNDGACAGGGTCSAVTGIFPSPLDPAAPGQCVDGTNNGVPCTDNSPCTGGGTCTYHRGAPGAIAGFGSTATDAVDGGVKRNGQVRVFS